MTIINVKEWLAAKPEDRKDLIEKGKTLSKLMWQEAIIEQAIISFEESLDTIEYELCEGWSYEKMERTYEWAARSANDIYRADGYQLVISTHPHLAPSLPIYYQMWIEEFKAKKEREDEEILKHNNSFTTR